MRITGMRIAIIQCSWQLGGAERQGLLLGRELRKKGADVSCFAMCSPGPLPAVCAGDDIPFVALPRVESRFAPVCAWRLQHAGRLVAAWKPDVLLPYTMPANVLGGHLSRRTGIPSIWNQRDEGLNPLPRRLEDAAISACASYTANGTAGAHFLHQRFAIDNCRIIPNAVDLPPPLADRSVWRRELDIADDGRLVVMIGNLHRNKDHATLLRAWAIVERSAPGCRLLLAGAYAGTEAMLRGLVETLGLTGVSMPGHVADISGLLAAADLAVFSSRSEGSPNGVLEAMSAGLAVVATDLPGVRELGIEPSLRVQAGDHESLAASLLRLLLDPTERSVIGQRNGALIDDRHSPHRLAEGMLALIAESLGEAQRGPAGT